MDAVAHRPHLVSYPARRIPDFDPQPRVLVIDQNEHLWSELGRSLAFLGIALDFIPHLPNYFADERPETPICLIAPIAPGCGGLRVLRKLNTAANYVPLIFVAEFANVAMSVEAMKSGAVDFLCRPYLDDDLVAAVEIGLARDRLRCEARRSLNRLSRHYETLSERERQVMDHVVRGKMNKQVAFALGISEITVKAHRGKLMRKMEAKSLPDLTRMADALAHGSRSRDIRASSSVPAHAYQLPW